MSRVNVKRFQSTQLALGQENPAAIASGGRGVDSAGRNGRPKSGNEVDWSKLVRAFGRRWLTATTLGVVFGLAAAGAAYKFLPAPYTSTAEIYFKSFRDNLAFETQERQAKFDTLKQTHQKLATGGKVLTSALRNPKVSGSRTLAGVADKQAWLAKNLVVKAAGSEFFTIALSGDHPDELATIVNAVTDAYITEVVVAEQEDRRARLVELEEIAQRVNEELELKRNELRKLTEATNSATATMFDQKQQFLLTMHVELSKQLAQVRLDLIRAEVDRQLDPGGGPNPASFPSDAAVEAYLEQEPEYRAAMARAEEYRWAAANDNQELGRDHPRNAETRRKLASAEANLARLRKTLRPRVLEKIASDRDAGRPAEAPDSDRQVASLRATEEQLQKELESIKIKEKETGVFSLDLEHLTEEIGRREGMAASLAGEIDRRRFELRSDRLQAEVSQRADAPAEASVKKRLLGTGLAGAGVFALLVGGITFAEYRTAKISSVGDVSEGLSLRLFGTVPAMPRAALTGGDGTGSAKSRFWKSALKESVDAARTMLLSLADRGDLKVILIASAGGGEGKTTLSTQLGTSLARSGRRVALVDCDVRRPSLSEVFGLPDEIGVCEIVRGEATAKDALRPTGTEGLTVLPAGSLDDSVLEKIAGDGLETLFATLREEFDFVIVDSSPVLPVCDSLLIARHADGVMLSIRRDVSRLSSVASAVERFRSIDVPVLGAVAIGLSDDPIGYASLYRHRSSRAYVTAG